MPASAPPGRTPAQPSAAAASPATTDAAAAGGAIASAAAPGEAAAAPAAPVIDTSSPKGIVDSLAKSRPSVAAAAYEQAQAAAGPTLDTQRAAAEAALPKIPAPTGIAPSGAAAPQAEAAPAPATPEVSGPTGPESVAPPEIPVPVAGPMAVAPTTLSGAATAEQGATDKRMSRSAQTALARVDMPTEDVPETLGPPPQVDISGAADPGQIDTNDMEAGTQVGGEHTHAQGLIAQDFGETSIGPAPSSEILAAGKPLTAATPAPAIESEPILLAGDVAAGLDASLGPALEQRLAEQSAEYEIAEGKHDADVAASHAKAQGDMAALEEQTRTEQTTATEKAKSEVATQRGAWRSEIDTVQKDFGDSASAAKTEKLGEVESEKTKADAEASKKVAEAEVEVADEKRKADEEAAQKKRDAEEESDGFWGWVKSKAKALIDGLKAAVKFVFDNLRKLVKGIFDAVKAVVLAVIDLARSVIVGLIKAFGELLKAFVSIALAAFPELAAKFNKAIDDAVGVAVDAVNTLADGLKSAVTAVLDFLASTIDSALGLIQSVFNGLLTVIGMIVSGELKELLKRIGWLVEAAKTVPDSFETAALEELLGGNLDEPLSGDELQQAGKTPPGGVGTEGVGGASELPLEPLTENDIGVDAVAEGMELPPELAVELAQRAGENGTVDLGSSDDADRSVGSILAEAGASTQEAGGPAQDVAAQKNPDDGLTPRGRAEVKWQLMKDGISKWFSENWVKIALGAVAALLGLVALTIFTGGAILAAIPAIMAVLGPLFVGLTVLTLAGHVKSYVEQAWEGNIAAGGKSLSKGLAAGAIELISWLTGKAAGGLLKGAKAVVKGTKAAVQGATTLAKGSTKLLARGAKWVLQKGKLLLKGISSGFAKGYKKLKDLGKGLLERMRFKQFRIRMTGRRFVLEGLINPWIIVAEGRIEIVDRKTPGAMKIKPKQLEVLEEALEAGRKSGGTAPHPPLPPKGVAPPRGTPEGLDWRYERARFNKFIKTKTHDFPSRSDWKAANQGRQQPGPKLFGLGPHNQKIKEIADNITDGKVIAGGQSGEPERIFPTIGGKKSSRRPDILVERPDESIYGINVGKRSLKTGFAIKRELEELVDLVRAGVPMQWFPYN